MGGPSGPMGPGAAVMAANSMRGGQGPLGGGGPGSGNSNVFTSAGGMNERMMLERRREAAAREELADIKRMRRF